MPDLADPPTLPALYNYGKTRFKLFVIYLIGVYITLHRITKNSNKDITLHVNILYMKDIRVFP